MLIKYKKYFKMTLMICIILFSIISMDLYSNTAGEFKDLKLTDIKDISLSPETFGQWQSDEHFYDFSLSDQNDVKIINDIIKEIQYGKIEHNYNIGNTNEAIRYSYTPKTLEIDLKNGNCLYIYSASGGIRKNFPDGTYTYVPYEIKNLVKIYYIDKVDKKNSFFLEYCPKIKNILVYYKSYS